MLQVTHELLLSTQLYSYIFKPFPIAEGFMIRVAREQIPSLRAIVDMQRSHHSATPSRTIPIALVNAGRSTRSEIRGKPATSVHTFRPFQRRKTPETSICTRGLAAIAAARASYIDDDAGGGSKRAPRFYHPPPLPAAPGLQTRLDGTEAGHAMKTLRIQEGDVLELCDAQGSLQLARVTSLMKKSQLQVEAMEDARVIQWEGARWVIAAACGSLKGGRSDWLVEKSCELGAAAFQPLLTERSDSMGGKRGSSGSSKGPKSDGGGREARLERVAMAATKQSLRAHGMPVREPIDVAELVDQVAASPMSLVATAGAPGIVETLQGCSTEISRSIRESSECLVIIGPEGDFTPDELERIIAAGARPVGLGRNRLRTETAAIAALTAAQLCCQDIE